MINVDEHGNAEGMALLQQAHEIEAIALQCMQMQEREYRRAIEGHFLKAAQNLLLEAADLRAKAKAMPAPYASGVKP